MPGETLHATSLQPNLPLKGWGEGYMIPREHIQEMSNRIVDAFRPERVILFGSYAYGKPTETSDVDVLVLIAPPFSVDLLVRDPEDIRQRLEWNDFFIREIIEKGIVLYASTHA